MPAGTTCPIVHPAAIEIQLAERQHLPGRHEHLVPAEVDALRVLLPRRSVIPSGLASASWANARWSYGWLW